MTSLASFHFLRPLWLLALVPAVWLLWRQYQRINQVSTWRQVCDAHLLSHLWLERPGAKQRLPLILLGTGWLLAIVALAGPVWKQLPQITFKTQPARVLVLDLSAAMNAADLAPTRIERARFKIEDILDASGEGETALVVFAGEPHVVTPLTEDVATIKALLPALTPRIMPAAGDNAAPALELAAKLLTQAGARHGDILLLTEGIGDYASTLNAVRRVNTAGYRVSVLGIGTAEGAPVPLPGGGFDAMSRLDEKPLREIATLGAGRYSTITANDDDIQTTFHGYEAQRSGVSTSPSRSLARWMEYGVWLLLPLLVLAAAGYRKGWLGVVLALIILPPRADAFDWRYLWLNPDQLAARQLKQGDPQSAAHSFTRPDWRAAALHAAGDYDAAARAWQALQGADARYNQGNALARGGHYRLAIKAYDMALKLQPDHADAQANKSLLEALLRQQSRQNRQGASGAQQGRSGTTPSSQNSGGGRAQQSPGKQGHAHAQETPEKRQPAKPQSGTGNETGNQPRKALQRMPRQTVTLPGENRPPRQPPSAEEEADIALEQWLRQIPDDPSGLLRRKFMLEHLLRKQGIKSP